MPNKQSLMDVLQLIVDHSEGAARIALQEQDNIERRAMGAGHFLKVNGRRVGRDVEDYVGPFALVKGWDATLVDFLLEVLFPVRSKGLVESYQAAADALQKLGREVFSGDVLSQWDDLFAE